MTSKHSTPLPLYVGGRGTPLLLLHGIGGTWEIWKPILPLLEARHFVVAVTLPGHHGGPAYVGSGDVTVAGIADQLVAMLRAQGIDRAHVAGNSLGGWLAVELARRGFARSVVALSPAGGWRSERDYAAVARSFKVFYAAVDAIAFLTAPLVRFAWLRRALARQAMEHGERVPAAAFRAFLRAVARCDAFPGLLRTMGRDGPVAPLDAGATPIRIAWSDCDRALPYARYGRPFVDRVHGAEASFVPGVGHVPLYDDPQRVAATILDVTTRADAATQSRTSHRNPMENPT